MPELPEVETVRLTLKNQIIGEEINNVQVLCNRIIGDTNPEFFIKTLIHEHFRDIKRYGKYLIFILDHVSIISHLRMEGKYFLKNVDDEIIKHEHIIFNFTSGRSLRYHDTRKFGQMHLVPTTTFDEIMTYDELKKLGKEANDKTLDNIYLYDKLKNRHDVIKTALLDQSVIAGLGNIYVDEVLYLSKINPNTKSNYITLFDAKNIVSNSKIILDNAIKQGGTTIRSYTSSLGVTGRFQQELNVHTLVSKPCKRCNTLIIKDKVGGRGTYYCPNCQKLKPYIVGITGTIGSGKSSISSYLKKLGYIIIDADIISKKISEEEKVKSKIKDVFGDEYVVSNKLNRQRLANLIFKDEEKRNELNNILHPLIKEEMIEEINQVNNNIVFLDVPLLFETSFYELINASIMFYTKKDINIKRLSNRNNISLVDAKMMIEAQMDGEIKKTYATYVIDNSDTLELSYKQTDKILKLLEAKYHVR